MTDERTETFEDAMEAAQTPMAALAAAYNFAPSPVVKNFINRKVEELLLHELPKLALMLSGTPAVSAKEITEENTARHVYEAAVSAVDDNAAAVGKHLSATVRHHALDLADVIDSAIRSVLLEDEDANREAYMDILSAHAQIVAALACLPLNEQQAELIREHREKSSS